MLRRTIPSCHSSIFRSFLTSILPSFHSNHVSRPRGFCSCQGHRGPAGASCSGPAEDSPSRPARAPPSRPVGAYNNIISLVSSSKPHARIAIPYTFLLPIHSDMLTNSTLIIYILQNLSLCLLISVISLMILHHNYIIINFSLIILSIFVTHRYIVLLQKKTLTQSIIIILV